MIVYSVSSAVPTDGDDVSVPLTEGTYLWDELLDDEEVYPAATALDEEAEAGAAAVELG